MTTLWRVGDRVRFVREYVVPAAAESVPIPRLAPGVEAVVVKVKADSIWVSVPGTDLQVTLWFPDAFADDFAKTTLVERVKDGDAG